jgi:hypothetical protein
MMAIARQAQPQADSASEFSLRIAELLPEQGT